MANYPSVTQLLGSMKIADDGQRVSRAVSGKPIFSNWFSATRNAFQILHECSNTDKQAIESHYDGDRMNGFSFTFASENQAYTVRYADAPKCIPIEGANRWRVEVFLIEQ